MAPRARGLDAPMMNAEATLSVPSRASPRPARWLARSVVALVAAGVLVVTLAWTFGPGRFGMEPVQYVPFPFFLLPALFGVGVSFRLSSAWRVVSLLSLVSVATLVMGFEFHTADAGSDPIRMMTYNIKGYIGLGRSSGVALIAREIALHRPDILVLQDAKDLTNAEINSPGTLR